MPHVKQLKNDHRTILLNEREMSKKEKKFPPITTSSQVFPPILFSLAVHVSIYTRLLSSFFCTSFFLRINRHIHFRQYFSLSPISLPGSSFLTLDLYFRKVSQP